jgi:uncharacterized protein (DUF885 family)
MNHAGPRHGPGSTDAHEALIVLGERYFRTQHTFDPWNATLLGLSEFDHLVGDARTECSEQAAAEFRAIGAAVADLPAEQLNADDQVDRDVLATLTRGAMTEAADSLWAANASAKGYVSRQGLVFQAMPAMKADDDAGREAYLIRLSGLADMFARLGERYRTEAAAGRVPTQVGVLHAIDQLEGYLSLPLDEDALLGPARGGVAEPAAALMVAEGVRPAMLELAEVLSTALLPVARPDDRVGIRHLPDGEAAYQRAVARHTTTDATPEEIHEIGHQTLAQLRERWREVGTRAMGTGDVGEIAHRLRTDPALRFTTRAEIVGVAEAALERATAAQDEYYPHAGLPGCVIEEINAVEAEHASLAYYRPPAEDGSRPGAHCLLTTNPQERFRFEYECLAFHESVPGHHLQLATCQQLDIPRYRRHLDAEACSFNEGWGLYCEALAEELGLYSSDLDVLGRLSFMALRACRLVVDTGMHHLGWSRQQAIDFMTANTATTPTNVRNEVDRYIAWPGQALAYVMGQREILRLREESQDVLGERFSLPSFHHCVLRHGAVPLPVLARNVRQWQAQQVGA